MIDNIPALDYIREYFKKHVIASPFYTHLIISVDHDPDTTEQNTIYNQFFGADSVRWTNTTFDHYNKIVMLRQDFITKGYVSLRSIAELDTELGYNRMARKYVENPYFKAKLAGFRSNGLPQMIQAEDNAMSIDASDKRNIIALVRAERRKIERGERQPPALGRTRSGKPERLARFVLQERRKKREQSQHITLVPKHVDLSGWRPQSYVTELPVKKFKVRRIGPKHRQEREIVL